MTTTQTVSMSTACALGITLGYMTNALKIRFFPADSMLFCHCLGQCPTRKSKGSALGPWGTHHCTAEGSGHSCRFPWGQLLGKRGSCPHVCLGAVGFTSTPLSRGSKRRWQPRRKSLHCRSPLSARGSLSCSSSLWQIVGYS